MPPYFDSPNGPEFTLENLKNCGWETAVEESEGGSYGSKWSALTKSAEEAKSQGRIPESKALRLLSHISSMMLKPESRKEPFQPIAVFTDGRSAIPDDFTEQEINLLVDQQRSNDGLISSSFALGKRAAVCLGTTTIAATHHFKDFGLLGSTFRCCGSFRGNSDEESWTYHSDSRPLVLSCTWNDMKWACTSVTNANVNRT